MALFQGRILITDCSNQEDRDVVIESLLNHKLSRATLYVMVKDFKEITSLRQNFPTVVPFVLVPNENIEQTRRMIRLLPRMNHFVNFLGQDLALEFLNKRSDFRIKSISKAYAKNSIIDKIVVPSKQGIIFNVEDNGNNCVDNVVVAGSTASKSIKGSLKSVFKGGASSSSTVDERAPLLSHEQHAQNSEPETICNNRNHRSTGNNIWRLFVSVLYSICPCVNEGSVIIPAHEYPVGLDAELAAAFAQFHKSSVVSWSEKLIDAKRQKENAIRELQNSKEERIEKEYSRLIGSNINPLTASANRLQAFGNVREFIRREKEKVNRGFDRKTDLLYMEHYDVIVDDQFKMLVSFWKKMRLRP